MSFTNTLNQLTTTNKPLQAGTKNFDIKWLRQGLYEMGFDNSVAWDSSSPDGTYDDAVAKALISFNLQSE